MESMKKIIALLLIVIMVSAMGGAVVSAEETNAGNVDETETVSTPNAVFPIVSFGKTVSAFLGDSSVTHYNADGQLIQPAFREEKMSDDSKVTVLMYNGIANSGVQSDYAYYFLNDSLVALVADFIIPEGFTSEQVRDRLIANYGNPFNLNFESMGVIPEMIGASAHMEDGQEAWNYNAALSPVLQTVVDGMETVSLPTQTVIAVGTIREIEGHMFLAVFVDPSKKAVTDTWTLKLSDLAGISELTGEEQQKVSQYLDYLNYQLKKQAEEYIAYIKQQHGAQ